MQKRLLAYSTALLMIMSGCSSHKDASSKSYTPALSSFSEENIYTRNNKLVTNHVIQGFHIDSDGDVWFTQVTREKLYLSKVNPNKTKQANDNLQLSMLLTHFGHGTNTAIEEVGKDRYFWAGCYGTCNKSGQYWGEKLVGRVKVADGAVVPTDKCDEYFYIGEYTDMHPSIDADNDLLTINYADNSNKDYRCFVVYNLSDAKKAPLKEVKIVCSDGFCTGNPASTKDTTVSVVAHDLTALTPVGRPKFLKAGYGKPGDKYYFWQGFDVHKDRLYYAEGQDNKNLSGSYDKGNSYAYITVFDFDGNIVEERTQVSVISDKDALTKAGISVYGLMESEGVKIYNGKIYLGFSSVGINAEEKTRHHNVFVWKGK